MTIFLSLVACALIATTLLLLEIVEANRSIKPIEAEMETTHIGEWFVDRSYGGHIICRYVRNDDDEPTLEVWGGLLDGKPVHCWWIASEAQAMRALLNRRERERSVV